MELILNHAKEYIDLIQNKEKYSSVVYRSNNEISQLDLYSYFRIKFGKPNGILSFLRANDSDNFIQWHFSFKIDNFYFDVLGSTRFLEFQILTNKNETISENFTSIILYLNKCIKDNKAEIEKFKKLIETWSMFLNTYKRVNDVFTKYTEKYLKITEKQPTLPNKSVLTRKEMDLYIKEFKIFIEKIDYKKEYGLISKMLSPIVGESYINLTLFILAKKEIKNDERLFESLMRNQIDIKLKTMHLNCYSFIKQIDQNDLRFKNFLKLMNKRNDFLHGNVHPGVNKYDTVHFEGTIPLLNKEMDMSVEMSQSALFQISKEEIEFCKSAIDGIKSLIFESIAEDVRESLSRIYATSTLGWNENTKRVGILFPDYFSAGFPIKK